MERVSLGVKGLTEDISPFESWPFSSHGLFREHALFRVMAFFTMYFKRSFPHKTFRRPAQNMRATHSCQQKRDSPRRHCATPLLHSHGVPCT